MPNTSKQSLIVFAPHNKNISVKIVFLTVDNDFQLRVFVNYGEQLLVLRQKELSFLEDTGKWILSELCTDILALVRKALNDTRAEIERVGLTRHATMTKSQITEFIQSIRNKLTPPPMPLSEQFVRAVRYGTTTYIGSQIVLCTYAIFNAAVERDKERVKILRTGLEMMIVTHAKMDKAHEIMELLDQYINKTFEENGYDKALLE